MNLPDKFFFLKIAVLLLQALAEGDSAFWGELTTEEKVGAMVVIGDDGLTRDEFEEAWYGI